MLFFSAREKVRIVQAIHEAEQQTSGEMRVHVESRITGDAVAHTQRLFTQLGMHATDARNGVLIVLAVATHQVVVVGDDGINAVVPAGFWDDVIAVMTQHFREDRFADGLVAAIHRIGEKLQNFFPGTTRDLNELPDEISYSR